MARTGAFLAARGGVETQLIEKLQDLVELPATKPLLVLLQDPEDPLEEAHLAWEDEEASRGLKPELLLGLLQQSQEDGLVQEPGRDDEPPPLSSHVNGEKSRGRIGGGGVGVGIGGVGENGRPSSSAAADGLPPLHRLHQMDDLTDLLHLQHGTRH